MGRQLLQLTPAGEIITRILRVCSNAALRLPHVKLCEMLGLSWSTIPSAFKLPYRKAVMQIHPDKCDDPRATEASQLLNSVYDSVTATGG